MGWMNLTTPVKKYFPNRSEVINAAAENISSGKTIPKEELKKLEVLSMPLEMYINGGNQNWIDWAKRIETEDKLRDKPYEK